MIGNENHSDSIGNIKEFTRPSVILVPTRAINKFIEHTICRDAMKVILWIALNIAPCLDLNALAPFFFETNNS